jgi:hypothetical protein
VDAVVIDGALVVDVELRPVVGIEKELQPGWFGQPEFATVVDRVPLRAWKLVPRVGLLVLYL